ncbi:natural resistance-associated macrophage protein-domain-containing protein [Phycomyces nitens]|nr:natural resistance-associated macrophage protein-domain-containing protein [Phycomyces nitens]
MVPHEAHHDLLLNDDRMSLSDFGEGMGNYGFQHKRRHDNTDSTTFFCDLDIKPEVDTGTVTDEWFSFKKLWKYAGPGLLMSIAYLDPGNLESDLQSGAVAGYSLLWLLFWAHVIGLIFQLLSARLGIITGSHLAQLIRQSYSTRMSIVLWAFAQVAIIGADIMEIVGTAVALNILFGLPLWAGVIMTAMDTLTFMMIQRYGMRKIEAFFMVLITVMTVCFWVELIQSKPDVKEIMKGMVIPKIPLHTELQAVGMLGAIVMPHNMFLHSALVKSRDLGPDPSVRKLKEANFYFGIESALALLLSFFVNLAIVVVFAKVFYNPGQAGNIVIPGLGQAEAVLSKTLGPAAKYLWAGGLLAAGQSSTMTGTLAGQYVCEGFFGMIFKKEWHRMAATRGISLVPGILVAVFAVDHFDTMGEMLNVLQSICLPTVLIPIMKLSWSPDVVPAEFRLSTPVHIICITLVCVVIGFDVFLFVRHINSLTSFILIGLFSTAWIVSWN